MEQKQARPWGTYGALVASGAVLTMIVGFTLGGWVTGGTASDMQSAGERSGRVTTLASVCAAMARNDSEFSTKLAIIKEAGRWDKDDALEDAGWAKVPGIPEMSSGAIRDCIELLETPEA